MLQPELKTETQIDPINAFPVEIQEIIDHYATYKGYPHEFFITAMLAAASTALGRSVILRSGPYEVVGIIWAATIAKPGLNKSAAQTDAFRPIKNAQFEILKSHERELTQLEEIKRNNPKDKTELPDPEKFLLSDITPEALSIVLSKNPKGCGIVYDELSGFVGRFNRYNAGADEQMFLSLFNGDTILRTRVNSHGNAAIKQSFLSIIGTIQPDVMKRVFADKADSGFFDRWLMCYPQDIKKPYPMNYTINPIIQNRYDSIIHRLLLLTYDGYNFTEMNYCAESYNIIYKYQCSLVDIQNATDKNSERAILAKMEVYLHRFSLLIQSLIYASNGIHADPSFLNTVSVEAANGAIILCEYFINEAHKMRIQNPDDLLKDQWVDIYKALPSHGNKFDRLQFIKICDKFGVKARQADNFLKANADRSEEKLLFKISHGVYTKNLF